MGYSKSKKSLVQKIYSHQKESSKKRGHNLPTYTKKDLEEWLYSQKKFHILYDNWKKREFDRNYTPSVDRKNDDIGYTLKNIQLMTWGENRLKFQKSSRNKNRNLCKEVYSCRNCVIVRYSSIKEASNYTGVDCGDISRVCKGKRKKAGGYTWKYKNNKEI